MVSLFSHLPDSVQISGYWLWPFSLGLASKTPHLQGAGFLLFGAAMSLERQLPDLAIELQNFQRY